MKIFKRNIQRYVGLLILAFIAITVNIKCKKMIEIPAPVISLNSGNVFESDATAIAVLNGIYGQMTNSAGLVGNSGIAIASGLSSDELTLFSGVTSNLASAKLQALYRNKFNIKSIANDESPLFWDFFYTHLFSINSAIEGISSSTKLTISVKQQLLGEAKFLRAYCYFYLVNLYGQVPLALTSDPKINNNLYRFDINKIYDQVLADLKDAQSLLSDTFVNVNLQPYIGASERVRPTAWSATALMARVYLYRKDFINAELESTKVIEKSGGLFGLSNINTVFLKNSLETIWALQPVKSSRNTEDGIAFILPISGPSDVNTSSVGFPVYLSDQLLSAFEATDQRKNIGNWVNKVALANGTVYNYSFKYKAATGSVTEYQVILRLGEQYMIRAEARAELGKLQASIDDINVIRREHGGLTTPLSTPINEKSCLEIVLHERQVELFCEGHRWLDLKRTSKVNEVMSIILPLKTNGDSWNQYMQFYPIPFRSLQFGTNLIQNQGYN